MLDEELVTKDETTKENERENSGHTGYGVNGYGPKPYEQRKDYNQNANYYQWQQSMPYSQTPQMKKQKSGIGAKIAIAAMVGLIFGATASGAYIGVSVLSKNVLADYLPKVENVIESVEEATTGDEIAEIPAPSKEPEVKVPSVSDDKEASDSGIAQPTIAGDGTYTVAEIAQLCMPSVVSITNKSVQEFQSWWGPMQQENESCGSGIIVGQNDTELIIATNNHVVAGANKLSVCFNDNTEQVYPALTKGTDVTNDLAIIAINLSDIPEEVLKTIRIAELGDSEMLQVGEQVVAIGNALGYGQSVTSGYISALNRSIDIDQKRAEFIQTDAAINPGNSGGALINMKGQVIGINSAKLANSMIEGMGYAIPISTALPILNDLENRETRVKVAEGEQGILGISCQNVSNEASELYGIPTGVYIGELTEGGAAQKAGLRKADVLIKFDGLNITSVAELKATLQYYKAGETVDVVVSRMGDEGYQDVTIQVTLDAKTQ